MEINISPIANRHDVFIAIGRYKDNLIPDIKCCENDAELMSSTLRGIPYVTGHSPKQLILTTKYNPEDCNKTKILSAIGQLVMGLNADDMVLLMISCHGFSHDGETYLIPYDAIFGEINSYISFTWIKELLDEFNVKFKVILIDACHSGDHKIQFKAAHGKLKFDENTRVVNQLIQESHGLAYATSCKHDQVALIQPDGKYSIWFHSLVEAIKNENLCSKGTLLTLDTILSKSLHDTMLLANKYWSRPQTPFCVLKIEGLIPLGLKR